MSAYIYPNFLSKAAAKHALARGEKITACENTPWGRRDITEGKYTAEGPHYPEPHHWYGQIDVREGYVVSIK